MRIIRTNPFKRDYKKLPKSIKPKTGKALRLLIANPSHPSLHIKKTKGIIKGYRNALEGRITLKYRFIFRIEKGAYVLLRCGHHDEFFK